MCVCVCVCVERERERERKRCSACRSTSTRLLVPFSTAVLGPAFVQDFFGCRQQLGREIPKYPLCLCALLFLLCAPLLRLPGHLHQGELLSVRAQTMLLGRRCKILVLVLEKARRVELE